MTADWDFVDAFDAAAGATPAVDYATVADLSEITVVSKDIESAFGGIASIVEGKGAGQALA